MDNKTEHEFSLEHEEVFIGISESLYRFGIMFGVLGLALIALGVAAFLTGAYGGGLAGPLIGVAGAFAGIGGFLFLRPRASFDRITTSRGRDIARLMDGIEDLDSAHKVLCALLVAFVIARLVAFFI
jgi:hypothetical protein